VINTFDTDGQTISCLVHRDDTDRRRRALVFLHGSSGDHTVWEHQYGLLKDLYDIAAPDHPGHGASAGQAKEEIAAHVPWLKGLLDRLTFERPVLVGHSIGAAIALAFALRHGERLGGIVLVGGGAKMPVNPMILTGLKTDPAAVIAMIPRFAVAKTNRESIGAILAARLSGVNTEMLYKNLAACGRFDVSEQAGNIGVPTLVVCGTEDKMTAPALSEDLARRIPGAQLKLIANAGHYAMMEEPEAFNRVLAEFVSSLA